MPEVYHVRQGNSVHKLLLDPLSWPSQAVHRDECCGCVELAYKALTAGEGVKGTDAAAAVQASYDNDKTDEFVLPTVIEKDGQPVISVHCIVTSGNNTDLSNTDFFHLGFQLFNEFFS